MRLSRLRAASASATRFLRLRRDGAWLVELLRLAIDLSGKWHAALPRARHRIYMCPASRGVVGACPGAAMHVSRPVVHALSRNTHSAASSRRHLLAHTAEIDLYHPDLLQHLSRRIWCIVSAFFFHERVCHKCFVKTKLKRIIWQEGSVINDYRILLPSPSATTEGKARARAHVGAWRSLTVVDRSGVGVDIFLSAGHGCGNWKPELDRTDTLAARGHRP
jgi:hypothetical protein